MNTIERFDDTAARYPAAAAVVWDDGPRAESMTFGDLAARSRRIAALFSRAGLGRGDAVLVLLPFGATFIAVAGALMRGGLAAVFIDPAQGRSNLEGALSRLTVRGVVGTVKACAFRWLSPQLRRIPHVFVDGLFPGATALGEAAALSPEGPPADCDAGSVALVSFTSGTTGPPKAIARTHGTLTAMQRMLEREVDLAAGEIHLSTLPFAALAELAAGATCVVPYMHDDGSRVGRIAAQIRAHSVEVVVASPAVAERLADEGSHSLASVRRVYVGGAPVFPRLLDAWARAAPAARVTVIYGMTEAEPISKLPGIEYGDAERTATREGAGLLVGHPVSGAAVRIAEHRHPGAFVAPCGEGEVCVSGPHVSTRTIGESQDRQVTFFADGCEWLRTGDAGYFDVRGRLWMTGRCRDAVEVGETGVHPLRVEAALADDPTVARAAYVASGGQRIVVIQPRERGSMCDLEGISARVAFAAPEAIAVVDHIPLDARHAAKVDYRGLRRVIAAGQFRQFHKLSAIATVPRLRLASG